MRILGIDIGSSSIKAVEVDSAFGRTEIHEYYEQAITEGQPLSEALTLLLEKLSKKPDKIAVCYPAAKTTFRNILIPSRDRKTIRSRVSFELEDEIPFPIEDCTYDYVVLEQNVQGSTIHITSTLTRNAQDMVAKLQLATLDPDFIIPEAWTWRSLLNRILPAETQKNPRLLIHIGNHRTLIYLHRKSMPLLIREIAWGKADLNDTASIPENAAYSNELAISMQPLITELRQVKLSCVNLCDEMPELIYLSGLASLSTGLSAYIQEEIQIPAELFRPMSAMASGLTYTEHTDVIFGPALSAALCVASASKVPTINLRKDALAKVSAGPKIQLRLLKKPIFATASILTTLFLSLTVQSFVYQSRLKEVDAQLEKNIRYFFGQIASSAVKSYISSPSSLKNSIQKELNKQKELAQLFVPHEQSPLEFIRSLSNSIPRDIVVDMTKIQVGAAPTASFTPQAEQTAQLTFLVANPQIAEKLAQLMSEKMPDLKRGLVEEAPSDDPASKRWKITFNGKTNESYYGK